MSNLLQWAINSIEKMQAGEADEREVQAFLAEARASVAEPVAWRVSRDGVADYSANYYIRRSDAADYLAKIGAPFGIFQIVPLYAAPVAAEGWAEAVDGWYFEVKRGHCVEQKDGRFKHYPASGLAYAGGLTKEQVDELDWRVQDFMDSVGRSRFTEYGKQQHEAKRAMYAPAAPGMRLVPEKIAEWRKRFDALPSGDINQYGDASNLLIDMICELEEAAAKGRAL